jgi:hypothetical protein
MHITLFVLEHIETHKPDDLWKLCLTLTSWKYTEIILNEFHKYIEGKVGTQISNIASHTTGKNGNFEHSKIDYIVSKTKWGSRGHMSFPAWIPHVLHVACHVSATVFICLCYFFPIPLHLFQIQLGRDYDAMQHFSIYVFY